LQSLVQTPRPLNIKFGDQTEEPMRIASHIATALSAATGRSNGSNGWQLVCARPAYRDLVGSSKRHDQGRFRLKPE
jgi:hypothetical protein